VRRGQPVARPKWSVQAGSQVVAGQVVRAGGWVVGDASRCPGGDRCGWLTGWCGGVRDSAAREVEGVAA
jgi:hypothetical protein